MAPDEAIDRHTIRKHPGTLPIRYQSWQKLLFLHWRLPPERLRPHLPPSLALDTFEGDAWISQGLPQPAGNPLLHYAQRRDVSVWPLQRVA